jgi:hypothetical protein
MKTKIIVLVGAFFISFSTPSQNNTCEAYFPFKEGITFEITNYNKNGKKEGAANYEITKIENNTATIKTIISDAKGKEITTTSYQVTCQGNSISIDFKSLINAEMFKQYKDMDMDVTGTNIELPNNLQVRQALNDANLNVAINIGALNMNMKIDMLNRMVDKKESVTTPAGTFECFNISYDSETKMGMKIKIKIKEWIAKGIGLVRSESYNKNGKPMGYSELTNFKK